MQQRKDFSEIIGRVDDIRNFFKSGDEILPFLGDLFQFLQDMMPLMYEANSSLMESTNNIPTASDRISDVTHATELATTEIMDKLDAISDKLLAIAKKTDPKYQQELEKIVDEVGDIHVSLQFQDITSQKLEHANRILSAIYERFINLFKAAEAVHNNSWLGFNIIENIGTGSRTEKFKDAATQFNSKVADTVHEEGISQDDIDQLFK